MATEQYEKLIDELCKLVEMPVQPSFYDRVDLEIDRVFFSLIEGKPAKVGDAAPGAGKNSPRPAPLKTEHSKGQAVIVIFCDFGPLPRHQQEAVMQRLLELNLSLQGEEQPVMSMNHENGHVLLSRRLSLAGLDALDLINKMKDHAGQAKQWRNGGCFLDGPGKASPRKSDGARRQLLRFSSAA
ncbi:CesT family type III secretion system chaperone [Herbaspirillum sp. RV1423]|uniref:CesT family type III secretion system chaperone n=1 Tax=Herbaspirillum sp. RV1423 TaxID=1443993 RepID=UPI0004AD6614|nr:CesT family type III secretion system chaperone [Herbaspirillum sp. RV1423]